MLIERFWVFFVLGNKKAPKRGFVTRDLPLSKQIVDDWNNILPYLDYPIPTTFELIHFYMVFTHSSAKPKLIVIPAPPNPLMMYTFVSGCKNTSVLPLVIFG